MRVLVAAATTGYQTRAFGDAAARLGVELVFATDRCHLIDDPWQDGAVPIRFYDEDGSVAAILAAARERPIDGVLVVGDRPTVIAARAAQALGLPWHPPAAAAVARNKQLTRERLRDAGLPVPWFTTAALDAEVPIPDSRLFPCIVKPVALSGSRGVMRANDAAELAAALERLRALMRLPDIRAERNDAHATVLVEGFIPGREYAVEGMMHRGELHVLAIFDKPDPLDGPFFEETIYVTPSAASAAEQRAIGDAVTHAAQAIGLDHGPIHAECRVNGDGVFVLEVAARPIGGLCARALRFETRDVGFGLRGPSDSRNSHEAAGSRRARAAHDAREPLNSRDARERDSRVGGPDAPDAARSLEELLLAHALGADPAVWTRERDASGVMMIPIPRRGVYRRVSGIDAARAVAHVEDVRITAKADQLLVPLPEGASYLGFIFARAPRAADVERALRDAHARLTFAIDPEFPVLGAGQINYNRSHG